MNNEEKLLSILETIQGDIKSIDARLSGVEHNQSEMYEEIRGLSQTVAKIEVEHGNKLSALYDAHIDTVRNATTIKELDAKIEDHDNRIWALEQKVKAK
ncbi:MAG: hypothetical protein FWE66_03990 [Oscillospiraceae bacterium]|nr:hypothetical protein [Oscillospiraceae bacterium]